MKSELFMCLPMSLPVGVQKHPEYEVDAALAFTAPMLGPYISFLESQGGSGAERTEETSVGA